MQPKDILAKVSANKKKGASEVIKEKSQGTITGSLIGGGVGLIYAFTAKKSYLVWFTVGILAGGIISNILIGNEINKPIKSTN